MSRSVEVADMEFNGDGAMGFLIRDRHHELNRRMPVTNLKTLSAIGIVTAAIATPVFAQPIHHVRHHYRDFRGSYNQMIGPSYAIPSSQSERNIENFQFNRSFPGGEDPSDHPAGN